MFEVIQTPLMGLKALRRRQNGDERGFLARLYCAGELAGAGIDLPVSQINQSQTRLAGTVRGLHFQYPPFAEAKLVTCLQGEIFDVALDLRAGSPTFLRWHARVLSAANLTSLFIPMGFAHGFQALRPECEILYLHSAPYTASASGIVDAFDRTLDIPWPLPLALISERDRSSGMMVAGFEGLVL